MEQQNKKFKEIYDVNDYEVLTDTEWKNVTKVCKTIPYEVFEVTLEDGKSLKCADDHILFSNNEEVFVKDIDINRFIDTKDGPKKCVSIKNLGYEEYMYDLQVEGQKFYTNGFLSHNTTVVGIYALWYALFHSDKNIGIVSNKETSAKMILGRLKRMYESLPPWMKAGVTKYAEKGIAFDNGTRITISATSPDAFRGESMNLLLCIGGENLVKVKDKITGEVKEISIEKLYNELDKMS